MTASPLTFTLDLEEHAAGGEARAPAATRRLLDVLDTDGVRATVFVVGELADAHPDLVREIAARGHEVALHGWRHVDLPSLTPAEFRSDTARGRALLEDLAGEPVAGYRAPRFSLVPAAHWAIAELAELGFAYSSSVLPARNPLHGDPSAPNRPFRWPNGLVELPCPVARVGPIALPYLGGTYLRLLPLPVVRLARRLFDRDRLVWTYCHPYDVDPDEPFHVDPSVGHLGSRLLWAGRRGALRKLQRLLTDAGPPLRERVAGLDVPPG